MYTALVRFSLTTSPEGGGQEHSGLSVMTDMSCLTVEDPGNYSYHGANFGLAPAPGARGFPSSDRTSTQMPLFLV